jgi:hypothetical protein
MTLVRLQVVRLRSVQTWSQYYLLALCPSPVEDPQLSFILGSAFSHFLIGSLQKLSRVADFGAKMDSYAQLWNFDLLGHRSEVQNRTCTHPVFCSNHSDYGQIFIIRKDNILNDIEIWYDL